MLAFAMAKYPSLGALALSCCLLVHLPLAAQTEAGTAQDPPKAEQGAAKPDPEPEAPRDLATRLQRFQPQRGTVALRDLAEVRLPDGWLWLDGGHGQAFLRMLGNRPGDAILGVAMPPDFDQSNMFAVYSYADDGHVADDEAPDFTALLQEMQESTREESKERVAAKLQSVDLLGWAEPPHYDRTQRKLYWATKLRFGDEQELTLNYNVRILGRTGHLVVNGVGGIEQLPAVAAHCQTLLGVSEFKAGQRYENFDPAYDKLAAYGIGGLVAGKLAAKVGILAKLLLLLKAGIKPILIGVVALGALVMKLLGRRKAAAAEPRG